MSQQDPRPDLPDVVRWIADDFGVDATSVERVVGGTDVAAAVWQASSGSDGFAVKWTSRRTRTGIRLSDSLTAAGVPGIPPTVRSTHGRPSSRRGGGRLSVTAWLPGEDAATVGLDLDGWEAYGALLAAVHAHPFPPQERRRGARRGIRRRRRRYRAGVVALDALVTAGDPDALDPALAAWRDARAHVELLLRGTRLTDRTDGVPVPCHGDPHLGNLVLDAQGAPCLIDWDEAVVAPREVDLHLVAFPVLFSPTTDPQAEAFRRGYGPVEIDESRLVRYACVRALEDLVSTCRAAFDGPVADRTEELAVFRGILSPVGSASLVRPRLERLLTTG
ncbi:phosphotransferase enzyme family protein [Curtobacterium sp. RRHDQ10]|uniref:phosphotransferase enzyme family protein n=1 Tax=Curtobacterium phyllosphaerae TaxID=3413379 RepID=UPI003BEF94E2